MSRRRVGLENKVSTALSQEHDFGGEVEDKARMPRQPSLHLGMLVGGIVVEDDMNDLANRRLGLESEEARQIGAVGVGKVRGHYGGIW